MPEKATVIFIFIAVALLSLKGFAQSDSIITKVVVFKDDGFEEYSTKEKKVSNVKNAIKINPLAMAVGDIPVYYERRLNNFLSAEAGLGLTFRNYMHDFVWDTDDLVDMDRETAIKLGTSFKIGVRIFPGKGSLDGYYFATEYNYRSYHMDVYKRSSFDRYTNTSLREDKIFNDFRLVFGYQDLSWTDNVFIDWYTGVGIGARNIRKVSETEEYNDILGHYEYNYSIVPKQMTLPLLLAGFKLAFGF